MATASEHLIAVIENLNAPFDLSPYIEYIEDPDRSITYEKIQSGEYDDKWLRNTEHYFIGHHVENRYWFRFTVQYQDDFSDLKPVLYLPIHPHNLLELLLWIPDTQNASEPVRQINTGYLQPISQHDIPNQRFVFYTPLTQSTYTVVGWVDNRHTAIPALLPFKIMTKQQFESTDQQSRDIAIIFYAIMFTLLLYNGCLYVSLKQPLYGFYLLFLSTAIFACAGMDGTTRLLWPNTPQINFRLILANSGALPFFYTLFIWAALDRFHYSPRLSKCFCYFFWLGILVVLHNSITPFLNQANALSQLYGGLTMPFLLLAILTAIKERLPIANYLLIAEVCAISGGTTFLLMLQGLLPVTVFTTWPLHAGFLSEAILLSLALAARTRLAQQQSITHLEKYASLYEDSIKGRFQFNLLDNSMKCNEAMARIFGFENKAALLAVNHSENRALKIWSDKNLMGPVFQQGFVTDYEIPIVSAATQKEVWVSLTMQVIKNVQGKPISTDGTMVDITERKLREKLQQDYKTLFDQSPQGLFTYSFKDACFTCNDAWARMHGFINAEALQKNGGTLSKDTSLLIGSYSNDELFRLLQQNGKILNLESQTKLAIHEANNPDHKIWISLSLELIRDETGKADFIEGSCTDITERKLKEEAEKEKLFVLSQNQAKSQFFASMSHELRTPLTAILGYSEAALSDDVQLDFINNAAKRINHSGKHLLQIINDILDISKVEAQQLEIEQTQVYLLPLMEEVNDTLGILVENKGLSFVINYQFPLPKIITSDATRIKQILLNLCGNAIKFTDKGGVAIAIRCDKDKQLLTFDIHDTGIGLKSEQIDKLFAAFMQADAATTRNYGGTGLGLHLSKQLAQKLGGDITVSSTYGQGSTFTVTIATDSLKNVEWYKRLPGSTDQQDTSIPRLTGHVLYAEDNEDNQRLVKDIVEQTGVKITVASNGKKALELCEQHNFDLVFTDVRMPIIDGVELTKILLGKNPELPVVVITATLMDIEIEEFNAVGFKRILRKPIDRQAIVEVLSEYLQAHKSP